MVAVRFLIREVWQSMPVRGRRNGVSPYGRPSSGDPDPLPRRLRPTRWITQAPFSGTFSTPTQKTPQHGDWEVCMGVMSEGCPSVTSEKHMTWGLIGVSLDVSDELHNGTSHEVTLIDSISVTDGGHVLFEGQRHPQAGLIWMFGHRQFLSSFWILEITRSTVSIIRSSLGLWVRGIFFRLHKVLMSGFDWLFFMRFTPVQQSLQEYLGVLVNDSFRWILRNILKGNSRVKS
jgi:hypothetical protein